MKNLTLEHIAEACGGIYRGTEEQKKRKLPVSLRTAEKQKRAVFSYPLKEPERTDTLSLSRS